MPPPVPPPRTRNGTHPRVSASLARSTPDSADLEAFADACRRFYYQSQSSAASATSHEDDPAAKIDAILREIPAAHRATYIKLQAAIRSRFHRDAETRRFRTFMDTMDSLKSHQAIIKALGTGPTASGNVAVMRSSAAKRVRKERLQKFIKEYAARSLPGPHPFLRYLFVTLRVQSLEENAGGAGNHVACLELEDEIWMESGTEKFTLDAIELVKGVLGFSEIDVQERRTSVLSSPPTSAGPPSARPDPPPRNLKNTVNSFSETPRNRSGSDPFVDPGDGNPNTAAAASTGTNRDSDHLDPRRFSQTSLNVRSPDITQPFLLPNNRDSANSSMLNSLENASPAQLVDLLDPNSVVSQISPPPPTRIRTFAVASYITNPELNDLCSLFPIWISHTRSGDGLPLVAVHRPNMNNPKALEEGLHQFMDENVVNSASNRPTSSASSRTYSGRVVIGEGIRLDGYRGTLLARIAMWFRHLFSRRS